MELAAARAALHRPKNSQTESDKAQQASSLLRLRYEGNKDNNRRRSGEALSLLCQLWPPSTIAQHEAGTTGVPSQIMARCGIALESGCGKEPIINRRLRRVAKPARIQSLATTETLQDSIIEM